MNTTVICIKKKNLQELGYRDLEHWLEDENHIYIGRNMEFYVKGAKKSKWQNQYSENKHGRIPCLELYEKFIRKTPELIGSLSELKGKTLGCWCKPDSCHGDILVKLLHNLEI